MARPLQQSTAHQGYHNMCHHPMDTINLFVNKNVNGEA